MRYKLLVTDDKAALREQLEAVTGEQIAALEGMGRWRARRRAGTRKRRAGMRGWIWVCEGSGERTHRRAVQWPPAMVACRQRGCLRGAWVLRAGRGGGRNRVGKIVDDPVQSIARACCKPVGQRGRVCADSLGRDVVPLRKYDLGAVELSGDQAVELLLRPFLVEEMRADDDDAEPGAGETTVDRTAQAVADGEREFVEPYRQAARLKGLRQRPEEVVLVLAGVADEDNPSRARSAGGGPSRGISCQRTSLGSWSIRSAIFSICSMPSSSERSAASGQPCPALRARSSRRRRIVSTRAAMA